jgi:hypothetical protein
MGSARATADGIINHLLSHGLSRAGRRLSAADGPADRRRS